MIRKFISTVIYIRPQFLRTKFWSVKLLNYQGNKTKFYEFHAIGLNMIMIKSQSKLIRRIWLFDCYFIKLFFFLELDIFINRQNLFQSTFLIFDTALAYKILLL